MAKKIDGYINLQVPAGQANPSPPIGPALGQRGLNIMEFCKQFNAKSKDMEPGAPVLEECLSVFECEIEQAVDAGDHTLFLGAVRRTACREGRPLVYFNSAYRQLD